MNVWKSDRKLFIHSLPWQNCNFAIVLQSWWKLGWTLDYTIFQLSARDLNVYGFVPDNILSPLLSQSLILPFSAWLGWYRRWESWPWCGSCSVNTPSGGRVGGKGLWLWLLIRNRRGTLLLVPVTTVPALRSARRGWGQGVQVSVAQPAACSSHPQPRARLGPASFCIPGCLFSEAIDANVSCSDSSEIISSSFLRSAEAPGECCSNRSKTGCCFSLLILSCSEFCCSGCICSVSCLCYKNVKSAFRKQVFSLMHWDIFIREVLSFNVFFGQWHSRVLWQLSESNETRANPYTRSRGKDKTSSSSDSWLTKRPDRISVSTWKNTEHLLKWEKVHPLRTMKEKSDFVHTLARSFLKERRK